MKSALTISAIRQICTNKKMQQPPITVEIKDIKKAHLISNKENVEIVYANKLSQWLLAQAAFNPGITKIYDDLLTFGKKSNEIYRTRVPQNFLDSKTFNDLLLSAIKLRKKGFEIIPIAVMRDGKIFVNPSNNKLGYLQSEDSLFVICESPQDLKKFDRMK